jgi:hypothetical protein
MTANGPGRVGKRQGALWLALLVAGLLPACTEEKKLVSGCSSDEECGEPAHWRCELTTGECLCRTAAACGTGEVCNSLGYCQANVGCYGSGDCPEGFFCDTTTNTCLADGRCAVDLHCKTGELCDAATRLCKAGSRSHGDCRLGEACLCREIADDGTEREVPCGCEATSEQERARCAVGRCSVEACVDDAFCGWGELCRAPSEGALPACESDYDPELRPYCDTCVYAPGEKACGEAPNFCLYSTYTQSTYCGVDCSQGQRCPNGYDCADVIVVWTKTRCESNSDCASPENRTDVPCASDADCPNHGLCDLAAGFCYGKCLKHEGANESFCSCVVDDDCAQDSCDPTKGLCSITKRACDMEGESCPRIRCVDFGEKGGCHIGQNCKPLEGLTCGDLRE